MELHFFKEFLMISHPTTVFLLLVFLLILAMIHHLEKKGTSFGKLVTIGTRIRCPPRDFYSGPRRISGRSNKSGLY